MTIKGIQNAIKARLTDVRVIYGNSFYVKVTLYYPDGSYSEFEAEDGKLFELDDECISVDIRIQCRHNHTYRSREYYFVTNN